MPATNHASLLYSSIGYNRKAHTQPSFTFVYTRTTGIVTCGSSIQLRHVESKKYHLKSKPEAKFSSGQQVVTLDVHSPDLWQVGNEHNKTCVVGEPIECGTVIRLTHLKTRKNLHSNSDTQRDVPAPLSRWNNEVNAFGKDGEGDSGDNFQVECLHRRGEDKKGVWEKDTRIQFRHVNSRYLLSSTTKAKYNQHNCPNCPIHGELEVSLTNKNGVEAISSTIFQAGEDGVYLRS